MRSAEEAKQTSLHENYSSYSSKPKGTRAYYLLLKKLGIEVETFEKDIASLKSKSGVCLLVKPDELLGKDDIIFLKYWVKKGNTLIYADDRQTVCWKLFGVYTNRVAAKEKDISFSTVKRFALDPKGLRTVRVKSTLRINKADETCKRLLWDEYGALVLVERVGKGRIYFSSDPYIFTNKFIGKKDNVLLCLALLANTKPGQTVYLDEYHHGFQQADVNLWDMLDPSVNAVFWQVVILLLLVGYSFFYRFGRPLRIRKFSTRSAEEYVYAVANLYYKAGKWDIVLQELYQSFYYKLAAYFGVSSDTSTEKIIRLCNNRWAGRQKLLTRLEVIMKRYHNLLDNESLTEKQVVQFATELQKVRKEIWNDV